MKMNAAGNSFRAMRRGLRRLTGRAPGERGASLAEVALLVPIFSLLLLAMIDLGRLGYISIEVANAARAGAAYGAQSHITAADSTGMVTAAKNDAPDLSTLSVTASHVCYCMNGSVTPTCQPMDCSSSRVELYVEVTTSATYTPWYSYKGHPPNWTVSSTSMMRAGN